MVGLLFGAFCSNTKESAMIMRVLGLTQGYNAAARLVRSGVTDKMAKFFLEPASPMPLASLRIGLSLVLIWQAFLMRDNFLNFFAHSGFVQAEVSKAFVDPILPCFNWIIDLFARFGINENSVLTGLGLCYIISLLFLFAGFYTRAAALLTWFLHWSFTNTGYSGAYGADMYAHFFLFYCIFIPCGEALSIDSLFKPKGFSYQARLALRLLQLHMCISYFASGIEKARGADWYNGEVMWRALNTPGYSIADFHWLALVPVVPIIGGWIVMTIEILYCFFIWSSKTRPYIIMATCFFHLGIALFLSLHVFGVLMCIPTLTLFAISADKNNLTE